VTQARNIQSAVVFPLLMSYFKLFIRATKKLRVNVITLYIIKNYHHDSLTSMYQVNNHLSIISYPSKYYMSHVLFI